MTRVQARSSIARGRETRPFSIEDISKVSTLTSDINNVYITLDKDGFLSAENDKSTLPTICILKAALAGDVQSKNLELVKEGHYWRFRLLRDVSPGEKFLLWFSEDVLVRVGMPFLTPKNIQGRKNYVCHHCTTQFEQPNDLKIHLLLSCKEYSYKKFWKIFFKKFEEANSPLNLSIAHLIPENLKSMDRPRSQENVIDDQTPSFRCYSEPPFSAFRPYKFLKPSEDLYSRFNNNTHLDSLLMHRISLPSSVPSYNPFINVKKFWNQVDSRVTDVSKSLEHVSLVDPAEVEAFATNWGKSKEGHLCVYCGKVYSRKYGLKIHIRTHTGYKPLQCKYCLRPFGDPSNLNKHVRLHSQCETPHKCHICGKMVVRRRDLERHMKSTHEVDEGTDEISFGECSD